MLWTAPSRHESAIEVGAVRTSHDSEEPGHAKDYDRRSRYREVSVQVHGVDAVGIEACESSHYWSREPQALDHTVRLMPPACVIAKVHDLTDAIGSYIGKYGLKREPISVHIGNGSKPH